MTEVVVKRGPGRPRKPPGRHISTKLSFRILDLIEAEAAENELSRSDVVRRMIALGLHSSGLMASGQENKS